MTDNRQNCFDFLRLFAAVAVMGSHAAEHLKQSMGLWFYDGVPLFFILSGMLVYKSYEKCVLQNRGIKTFYTNRFLRIAPAIYVYIIVVIFYLVLINAIPINLFIKGQFFKWLGSHLFLVPIYNPDFLKSFGIGSLNGSLWTIPVEFGFYLTVPIIFFIEKRKRFTGLFWMFSMVIALGAFMIYWGDASGITSFVFRFYKMAFPYLCFFCLGIFWAKKWDDVPRKFVYAAGAFVIYIAVRYSGIGANLPVYAVTFYNLLWGFPLSYAVVWFGRRDIFRLYRLTAFGDFSYGVYIWHMVIINSFIYFHVINAYVLYQVFGISLAVAMLSWFFIENPFLRLKQYTSRELS